MRISSQQNTNFRTVSEADKTKYAERRAAIEKFNRDYPNMAEKILNFSAMPTYIYVAASQIIQKDDGTSYVALFNTQPSGKVRFFSQVQRLLTTASLQ